MLYALFQWQELTFRQEFTQSYYDFTSLCFSNPSVQKFLAFISSSLFMGQLLQQQKQHFN